MALTRTIKDKLNIETYYRLPSCDMHHDTHSGDNAVLCDNDSDNDSDNDESNDSDHVLITVTISLNQYIMQE